VEQFVKVDLDQIERTLGLVFAEVRERNSSAVTLAADHYWSVPLNRLTDVTSAPPELGIGHVSECIEWLDALESDPTMPLPYHLTVVADILRVLGDSLAADFSVQNQTER